MAFRNHFSSHRDDRVHAVAVGAHPIDITSGPLTPTGRAVRILAECATPPGLRYRGPGKRFCLAPGVRVQRPRHAQRLAGSAPARPRLADRPQWRFP